MDLTLDELRLIAEFRKLSPAARDELLLHVAKLACRPGATPESGAPADQCRLKAVEQRPETEKGPIITE
ncbi:MAG: hypothetical protein HYV06_04700 [Deltaproteobacteria bacterium]|nr:hypothetical protein [Deltaproteobacteria bacterium]